MAIGPAVPTVSLRDFDDRRQEIIDHLMRAATEVGFLCVRFRGQRHAETHATRSAVSDHGLPKGVIDDIFSLSRAFFALPDEVKARTKHNGKNAGWEKNEQIRPSTGTPDAKESIQLQFARMEGMWPSDEDLPGFRQRAERFMLAAQESVPHSFVSPKSPAQCAQALGQDHGLLRRSARPSPRHVHDGHRRSGRRRQPVGPSHAALPRDRGQVVRPEHLESGVSRLSPPSVRTLTSCRAHGTQPVLAAKAALKAGQPTLTS